VLEEGQIDLVYDMNLYENFRLTVLNPYILDIEWGAFKEITSYKKDGKHVITAVPAKRTLEHKFILALIYMARGKEFVHNLLKNWGKQVTFHKMQNLVLAQILYEGVRRCEI